MIGKLSPYLIIALAVLAGFFYADIQRLERKIADMKLDQAQAMHLESVKRQKQLQDQADAYGKALAEAQAQRQRLAARNDSLNRQLKEVADYASRLADSLRLYLNSMLNPATGPAGWPALPADPAERVTAPAAPP